VQARQANVVKWVHSDDNATIFRDGWLLLAQLRARAHAQHTCLPPLPAPRFASTSAASTSAASASAASASAASTSAASTSAGHNPRKRIAVPAAAAGGAAAAAAAAVGAAEGKARKTTHQEQGAREAAACYEVACCDADHRGAWEGAWEACEIVAEYWSEARREEACDVQIAEDGELCLAVPRRLVRRKCLSPAG